MVEKRPRSLVVTGNCTTRGVADALRLLFPEATVHDVPAWELTTEQQVEQVSALVRECDAWVRMPLEVNSELDARRGDVRVIEAPVLFFAGFHPDVADAHQLDGSMFSGVFPYHSAIALWGWRRRLSIDEIAALFTPDVMRALAYDAYWTPSVTNMRADFDRSDIAFDDFWLRVKRRGAFMHTCNHPRSDALALLAKAVAVCLGAGPAIWDESIESYLDDPLARIVSPVYPPIAEALAVPGSYRWRLNDQHWPTLNAWLQAQVESYGDVDPSTLVCTRIDDGIYDEVLEPRVDVAGARRARLAS